MKKLIERLEERREKLPTNKAEASRYLWGLLDGIAHDIPGDTHVDDVLDSLYGTVQLHAGKEADKVWNMLSRNERRKIVKDIGVWS